MSTHKRPFRGVNHPYRKSAHENQGRRSEQIHRPKKLEITTSSDVDNVTVHDAVDKKCMLPGSHRSMLLTVPSEVLLEITRHLDVEHVQFFRSCKSLYHHYDRWLILKFGGRYEVFFLLTLKAPSLLTKERICTLVKMGAPISRRFAQFLSRDPKLRIPIEGRKHIISAYATNLWPEKHLNDTDLWKHCTSGSVTTLKMKTLHTLAGEYHFYPSPMDKCIGGDLAHIVAKMPESISDCKHILNDEYWQSRTLKHLFHQIGSHKLKPDEIENITSYLTNMPFGESLIRAFIYESSIDGFRTFLEFSSKLSLKFSLEDISRDLVCHDLFFRGSPLENHFWEKRVCLYEAFPCPEALQKHLVKLGVLKGEQDSTQDSFYPRCVSEESRNFLAEVSSGGTYFERPFYVVHYVKLIS